MRKLGGAARSETPLRTRSSSGAAGGFLEAAVAGENDGHPARWAGRQPQLEAALLAGRGDLYPERDERTVGGVRGDPNLAGGKAGIHRRASAGR